MPTYDYRCPNGHDFEHFYRKISDAEAELACPTCGALAQRRVSGGAGLVFKGSGFYLTDYGKNAHRKSAPDAATSSSNSDGAGESKTTSAGESTKSEGRAAPAPKSEAAPASGAKSDSAKSADKPSAKKSDGGDTK